MHWFRARSRLGSWLALFALAFQLAVSFGHVHLDAKGAGHAAVLADHSSADADSASLAGNDEAPALADDYCAVCALIQLAGTIVVAQVPVLPLPVFFAGTQTGPPAQFELTAHNHAPFSARAPPTA
jgi:hypothetical protein